ncbi:unnamed protein product [Rotaria magnacalcarata]
MNIPSYSPSENVQSAGCSTSSTPPIVMLTVNDYLDGLHFLHEAQKIMSDSSTSIPISIKYGSTTYHMRLDNQADLPKSEQFNMIANHIHIPSDRLKLIYRGKRFTKDNWHDLPLLSNMNFLSIGEQNEDETDVDKKDIECVMHQMKIDRNAAIKALKIYPNMSLIDIRENLSLFNDAFSIHRKIPEFQIDSTTAKQLIERINNVKHPLILVAYIDNRPVGYLMGHERYSSFYIWLAGVHPKHRRQGILVQLMNRLEQWAMKENYSSLMVKTRNSFKSMLLFLISHEFKLIDIDKRQSVDTHRLILEKKLIIPQQSSST